MKPPGYVDRDVSRHLKPRKPRWYYKRYGLDANDQRIAREAARRIEEFERWYAAPDTSAHGVGYGGETAEMYVERMLSGESWKRQAHVLQAALAEIAYSDEAKEAA